MSPRDRPRRVLQVLGPPDGGVAEHVVQLTRGLLERGWEVEVAAPVGSPGARAARATGAPVHELDFRRAPGPADLATVRRLRALDRRRDFDVVHAHSSKAGALVRAGLPRPGRHVYTPNCWAFAASFSRVEREAYRLVEQALVPRTGALVAASDWERREGLRRLRGSARRMHLVYNGVAPYASPPPPPDPELLAFKGDRPLVAMVAVLRPQKDPLSLVRAAAHLRDRGALTFRVAVVGNGELTDAVRAEIERLSLGDDVRHFPFAGSVGPYLSALDLFVLPSLWESFPLGLLEAMAAAKPIVATGVGGSAEAVLDGRIGFVIEPGDPEELARALADAMGDADRLAAFGAAGRARYEERFTLGTMVDAVQSVYNELAASSRSSA